jgi:hypothetical protein
VRAVEGSFCQKLPDEAARLAMRKCQELVRPDVPWCQSNIELICGINGLDSIDDVKLVVFDASYRVPGLGDVYLGAKSGREVPDGQRLVVLETMP